MITGRQVRAARGLLDWDATELADKAGLTRATVGRIEADLVQPQEKTMARIIQIFDAHGIEFLDDDGVRVRKHQVRVFAGKAGYRQFLDHIYDALKMQGGRIRQFNASDSAYLQYADDYVDAHLKRMEKIEELDARVLSVEGDAGFPANYCSYRWLDKESKALIPYYVYGEYLALPLFTSNKDIEIISIRSSLLSDKYVEQFDAFWDRAMIPGASKEKR